MAYLIQFHAKRWEFSRIYTWKCMQGFNCCRLACNIGAKHDNMATSEPIPLVEISELGWGLIRLKIGNKSWGGATSQVLERWTNYLLHFPLKSFKIKHWLLKKLEFRVSLAAYLVNVDAGPETNSAANGLVERRCWPKNAWAPERWLGLRMVMGWRWCERILGDFEPPLELWQHGHGHSLSLLSLFSILFRRKIKFHYGPKMTKHFVFSPFGLELLCFSLLAIRIMCRGIFEIMRVCNFTGTYVQKNR